MTTTDVVGDDRRAEGARIVGHLARAIVELTGTNPVPASVWDRVAKADRAFDRILVRWMQAGKDEDKAALRTAYREVLTAWKNALVTS